MSNLNKVISDALNKRAQVKDISKAKMFALKDADGKVESFIKVISVEGDDVIFENVKDKKAFGVLDMISKFLKLVPEPDKAQLQDLAHQLGVDMDAIEEIINTVRVSSSKKKADYLELGTEYVLADGNKVIYDKNNLDDAAGGYPAFVVSEGKQISDAKSEYEKDSVNTKWVDILNAGDKVILIDEGMNMYVQPVNKKNITLQIQDSEFKKFFKSSKKADDEKTEDAAPPTKIRELKKTPNKLDVSKAVPASVEMAEAIKSINESKSRLETISSAIKDLEIKFKEEKVRVEQEGGKIQSEIQLQNMIEALAKMMENSQIQVTKFGEELIAFNDEIVTESFKPSYKWKLDKLLAKYKDAGAYLEKAVAGAQNMATPERVRTLTVFPDKRKADGGNIFDDIKDVYNNLKKFMSSMIGLTEDVGEITEEGKEAANKKADEEQDKVDYFLKRTNNHIQAVQDNIAKIVAKHKEYTGTLENVKTHDASKLEEPERTPYIDITWRHKKDDFKSYKTPGDLIKKTENEATMHHILNNAHHPEYWLEDKSEANLNKDDRDKSDKVVDASKMPDDAVIEMVADWQAMSDELGKNTAREWFNKQKDVRWSFSSKQVELIDKILKVFEG